MLRTELVDLLRLPTHATAILTLVNMVGTEDESVSSSAISAIHNILWPLTNENLGFCASFLTLNRVRSLKVT
jgi:hypothetical protein